MVSQEKSEACDFYLSFWILQIPLGHFNVSDVGAQCLHCLCTVCTKVYVMALASAKSQAGCESGISQVWDNSNEGSVASRGVIGISHWAESSCYQRENVGF
jgi:hypothetical protein